MNHPLIAFAKLSKLGKTIRFALAVVVTLALIGMVIAFFLGCLVFDVVVNFHSLGL